MRVTPGHAIPAEPISAPPAPRSRWLGMCLLVLALAVAVNSVLGPLFTGVIDYPLTETLLNQTKGLEAFSLAIITPWSLAAGILALRGHPGAPILALAPAFYTVYMFVQYLIGPNYQYYPLVFPLHLGIFILACAVALTAWSTVDPTQLPPTSRRGDRGLSLVLLFLAAFVLFRYVPAIIDVITGKPLPAEAVEEPAMFWSIVWLDLGIVVPATITTAIALQRPTAWAKTASYALVGWFALVPPSVAAMAIVMLLSDDPRTTSADVLVLSIAALAFATIAGWLYRPLLARHPPTTLRKRRR
ncbi:MAG: hypothetical protein ACRDRV_03830 [Pseudonocardiaceae bacterium]